VYGEIAFAKWEQLKQEIDVELVPVGMLRGRTVRNAVLLVDEAQSLTPPQVKCVLTRLGPNSKVVLSGDTEQSERYTPKQSPLLEAVRRLDDLRPAVTTIRFARGRRDQLRDPLVSDVLDRL
jgi:phosphate starvation-inducible PhoH-like protein